MPSCEKCWSDSRSAAMYEEGAYGRLIDERNAAGKVCTPEQQAGEFATLCETCQRMTRHQHCQICMVCGDDPSRRYVVKFGASHSQSQWFATFPEALAFYRLHESDTPEGASLYGAGYDDEHDGLTQEERDEVIG